MLGLRLVGCIVPLLIVVHRRWSNDNLWMISCCGIAIGLLVGSIRRVLLVGHRSSLAIRTKLEVAICIPVAGASGAVGITNVVLFKGCSSERNTRFDSHSEALGSQQSVARKNYIPSCYE